MQGQLFSQDFLARGILETPPFQQLDGAPFDGFCAVLRDIYQGLDASSTINEAQTEALVITKVLTALGGIGTATFGAIALYALLNRRD